MKGEFIKMPHGGLTKLAKELGVSTVTVRSALEGITQSPKARMIRAMAKQKERGGDTYVRVNHSNTN